MVSEKTLSSPLDCKEIQPVHPKGDQSWVFIGRTDAEAETPILWPPDVNSWLIWKDRDAGRDWGQEEKGTTEDEMVGWHHRLNGYEFEWTLGVGDGQGGLACCGPWGRKVSGTTKRLSWSELSMTMSLTWIVGHTFPPCLPAGPTGFLSVFHMCLASLHYSLSPPTTTTAGLLHVLSLLCSVYS